MSIVAYKFVTQLKYIKEKETKRKQRPSSRRTEQGLWPFTMKKGTFVHTVDQLSVDNGSL